MFTALIFFLFKMSVLLYFVPHFGLPLALLLYIHQLLLRSASKAVLTVPTIVVRQNKCDFGEPRVWVHVNMENISHFRDMER